MCILRWESFVYDFDVMFLFVFLKPVCDRVERDCVAVCDEEWVFNGTLMFVQKFPVLFAHGVDHIGGVFYWLMVLSEALGFRVVFLAPFDAAKCCRERQDEPVSECQCEAVR